MAYTIGHIIHMSYIPEEIAIKNVRKVGINLHLICCFQMIKLDLKSDTSCQK